VIDVKFENNTVASFKPGKVTVHSDGKVYIEEWDSNVDAVALARHAMDWAIERIQKARRELNG